MKLLLAAVLCIQVLSFAQAKKCECGECLGSLELGIVLDSSSSISREDFSRAKTFLKDFVSSFDVGATGLRVSLISYGRDVHEEDAFNLGQYDSERSLLTAIDNLVHHHQIYTNTSGGIQYMRTHQLDLANCRPNVYRVAIVVTDGVSQETEMTANQAYLARESGIVMFSVGVGKNIDDKELRDISGDERRVFKVDNYAELEDITSRLAKKTCKAAELHYSMEKPEL